MVHLHDGEFETFRIERASTAPSRDRVVRVVRAITVQSAEVERTVETLKMEVEQIMKGKFKTTSCRRRSTSSRTP